MSEIELTVVAHLDHCDGGDCPTIFSDGQGNIGLQGSTAPGLTSEHISWMSEADFRHLIAQIG